LRDQTPALLPETLAAARERWQRAGLQDYELALTKHIDRQAPERIVTQVRGGRAVRLEVNGREMAPKDSYTVDGLLQLMDRELEMASAEHALAGQPQRAVLRAVFEKSLGLPVLFKRLASSNQSVILEIESLTSRDLLYQKP
jgi:hypothetical protein